MNKILLLALLLVGSTAAQAQTQTEQLLNLKARLEANAEKLSKLKAELAAEKALDDDLIVKTSTLITQSYERSNSITQIKNALPALETKTQFLWTMGNEVYIIGANLQVKSGSNLATNTLGNVIVGHNALRPSGNIRTGSHNLVFGNGANFSREYGIIGGFQNNLSAPYSAILSGTGNEVSGEALYQVVATGVNNKTTANATVALTGNNNLVSCVRGLVATGSYNRLLFGYENAIVSGDQGYIENGIRSYILTGLRNVIKNAECAGIGTGIDQYLNSNWKFSQDN
jgi:hypothetical protein